MCLQLIRHGISRPLPPAAIMVACEQWLPASACYGGGGEFMKGITWSVASAFLERDCCACLARSANCRNMVWGLKQA